MRAELTKRGYAYPPLSQRAGSKHPPGQANSYRLTRQGGGRGKLTLNSYEVTYPCGCRIAFWPEGPVDSFSPCEIHMDATVRGEKI